MSIFSSEYKLKISDYFDVTTTGTLLASTPLSRVYDGNLTNYIQHNGNSNYQINFTRKSNVVIPKLKTILGARVYNTNTTNGITGFNLRTLAKDGTLISLRTFSSVTPNNDPFESIFKNYYHIAYDPEDNLKAHTFRLTTSGFVASSFNLINEIELYGILDINPNFEFNDSVLETKGWNSSRYDGRQLSAAKRNEFTTGDITYGKTPVVERYTRNIYIGNEVVSIDPTSLDDTSLLPIENFSYLQSNYYITINEDETITHNRLEKTKTKSTEKIGFYQAFFDDFPEDETCNVVVFDNTVKNNLKSSYKIYFNGGQLQQLLKYESHTITTNFQLQAHFKVEYQKTYNRTRIFRKPSGIQSSQVVAADITINPLNKHIIREFFSQDLNLAGDAQGDDVKRTAKRHVDVYEGAFDFKNNSDYKGDKRFFLSFIKSNGSPLRTIATGSIPSSSDIPIRTENLAELSTIEIISASLDPSNVSFPNFLELNGVEKHPLNQDYNAQKSTTSWGSAGTPSLPSLNDITPPDIHGLVFSRVTDDVPSLLINLNKTNELRSGGGKFPYIIIPKNLHPYIKDNLKLYLSKAGINVGGDATQTIDEIIANKPRKPRLTPGVRKAISRGRRRGLLREEESNRDRRQRERENRRKKRKQNRENRKENRQENRQKRRENRQDRRQNRRNRRRNR